MRDVIASLIKTDRKVIFFIGLFSLCAYAAALNSPFKTLDDDLCIVRNEQIRHVSNFPQLFKSSFFDTNMYYRPLVSASYMAEYHFFGLKAVFYNIDNLLIHILSAYLVFLIAGIILGGRVRAFMAALLFAIHPIQWEAVGNVSGRAILLGTFFVLSGFWLFLKYRQTSRAVFLAGASVCYALGLLCKESAGILLFVLILYGCVMERKSLGKALQMVWPFLTIAILYWILRRSLGINQVYMWPDWQGYVLGFSTFLQGVGVYLKLLIVPTGLHFDRTLDLILSWTDWKLWTVWGVSVLLIGAWVKFRKAMPALVVFCLGWFLLELLPVSQIITTLGVQPGKISLAEHFMYAAIIPLGFIVVAGGAFLVKHEVERRVLSVIGARLCVAAVMVFFLVMTVQQSLYAGNEYVMLNRSLSLSPDNARIRHALGLMYIKVHQPKAALPHLKRASELDPFSARFRISYATGLCDVGRPLEGVREFQKVLDPGNLQGIFRKNQLRAYQQLIRQYMQKVRTDRRNSEFMFALGVFYYKAGYEKQADIVFRRAYSIDRKRFDALWNVGMISERLGQFKTAFKAYKILARAKHPKNLFRAQAKARMVELGMKIKKRSPSRRILKN